jgi:hypothetical protein
MYKSKIVQIKKLCKISRFNRPDLMSVHTTNKIMFSVSVHYTNPLSVNTTNLT